MREVSKFALYAAAGVLAFGVTAAKADITVVSWGGAYTASQQKAYSDTWTGGTVNWENYNGGLGEVRAQVEADSVQWDIVDVLPDQARTGCDEGLFEELPRDVFAKAPDGTSMDDDMLVPPPNTDHAIPRCVEMSWRRDNPHGNRRAFRSLFSAARRP